MLWITILILISGTALSFENQDYELILENYGRPLTQENVRFAIRNLENKEEIFKLIMVESGNLRSKLATKGQNLFGLRRAGHRQTTSIGTIYSYSKFKHWSLSIIDFLLWMRMSPIKKDEDFKKYLRRRRWN